MPEPYNPLDKRELGESIARNLLASSPLTFEDVGSLVGAGIYAIYYTGTFAPYAQLIEQNTENSLERPIYVGKAIPEGGRKGGTTFDASQGRALRGRLASHAQSIREATNLDLDDFRVRVLVVDDIWIPLGENILIERMRPLWNLVIDGFGNKTPGKNRLDQARSAWDVLHPGRGFAQNLGEGASLASVESKIERYFEAGEIAISPEQAAINEEQGQSPESS